MENENKDQGEILDDSGINDLPENEKKETQEIIDDIKKDEDKSSDKDVEKPKKDETPDPKKDEEKKPDEVKPDKEKELEKEPPRTKSKLIPSWILEKANRENKEKIEGLEKAINDLKTNQGDKPNDEISDTAKADLKAKIEKIAEDKGIDADVIESIVEIASSQGGKIPKELQEKLAGVDKILEESEIRAEETAFNSTFDKSVIPLIKAEYGDSVSTDTIEAIREKIKENAYTEEYKQTPYGVIYKGMDDFRKFKRPKEGSDDDGEKPADDGSSKDSKDLDFANVTEADIEKMDGTTFDKYSEWQENNERKRS